MKKLLLTLAVLSPLFAFAQQDKKILSGKILSSHDLKPMEGVSVFVSNSKAEIFGKTSNSDGQFLIPLSLESEKQLFVRLSFLGYKTLYDTLSIAELSKEWVFYMEQSSTDLEAVTISSSVLADPNAPVASQTIKRQEIQKLNLGQDLPVLLNTSPSLVFTTDAGAGVGYTSLRIRGSDQTRINVTLNGIPLNDPESQGVFWVNMPDFASSANRIDIQRGVGTSTNGAGAFGANINIETFDRSNTPTYEINNSFGSFNTRKHTAMFNTGLINKRWKMVGRLSQISSDGYLDRASSQLSSYYLATSYQSLNKKLSFDFIHFSGKEKTYQAWWGNPESSVKGDKEGMQAYADRNFLTPTQTQNLLNAGRTYNYYEYDNETDNYQQSHFQLHGNYQINKHLKVSLSGFYVKGAGYYEQFRESDRFSSYGLPSLIIGSDTITRSDIVRQRWLDNDYFGAVYGVHYQKNKLLIQAGGGANRYVGDHFGEIIWAQYAGTTPKDYRYYFNQSTKDDINAFAKVSNEVYKNLFVYADIQYRIVNYKANGLDDYRNSISFDNNFNFVNPKVGMNYLLKNNQRVYLSVATANREPVRRDFIDAAPGESPEPETLIDYELGYQKRTRKYVLEANLYYMDYFNQLVLTGELNDVGGYVRKNAGRSYRAGVELQGTYLVSNKISFGANLTLSDNRIKEYKEVVSDWFEVIDDQEFTYTNTPIAFSPSVIAAVFADYKPINDLTVSLICKHVGEQFLDNTGSELSKLDAYTTIDLRMAYKLPVRSVQADLILLINNATNAQFSSNGYTYKYYQGDVSTQYHEKMLYPQAGTNFLLGLNIRF